MPPASENGGQGQRSWLPVHFRRTTAWSASVGTWWARSATPCAREWISASWIRTGGCAGSSGSLANRRRRSDAEIRDVPRLGRGAAMTRFGTETPDLLGDFIITGGSNVYARGSRT